MLLPPWFPDWSGQVCAIVASGPSVVREEVESLRGRCKVVVVNNSHEIAPWADLLYAADGRWWDQYPKATRFEGLKVTADRDAAKRYGLHIATLLGETDKDSDKFAIEPSGAIARGGNSAFQAVNLVTRFGCRRQLWMGFDFTGEHWHGTHAAPLRNPRPQTLEKWARRFDAQAAALADMSVEVVNCSSLSVLKNYRRGTVETALSDWGAFA